MYSLDLMVTIVSLTQECENIAEQHKTGTRYIIKLHLKTK